MSSQEFQSLMSELAALRARVDKLAEVVSGMRAVCRVNESHRRENWKLVAGAVLAMGAGWITKHFGG